MPKNIKPLTAKEVEALPVGVHAVGGIQGLYIRKKRTTAGISSQYFFRYKKKGKQKALYLPRNLTLKDARALVTVYRRQVDEGSDPQEIRQEQERKKEDALKERERLEKEKSETFADAYGKLKEHQRKADRWRNNKKGEIDQDRRANKYLMPALGNKRLKEITVRDVADLLTPVFLSHPVTADKLKTTLTQVFNWANATGYGDLREYTPMTSALDALIKPVRARGKKSKHYPALPFEEAPSFVAALLEHADKYNSMSARVVAFATLTATRSKAARFIRWQSIDFEKGIYTIREEDDKEKGASPDRRIFLAKPVSDWLKTVPRYSEEFVFPSRQSWKPIDENAPIALIKKLHKDKKQRDGLGWVDRSIKDRQGEPSRITLHGMRATYRTWCADCKNGGHKPFDRDAVEFNLLHMPMGKVEQAYNRATLDEVRREIMEQWAKFCLSKTKLSRA